MEYSTIIYINYVYNQKMQLVIRRKDFCFGKIIQIQMFNSKHPAYVTSWINNSIILNVF